MGGIILTSPDFNQEITRAFLKCRSNKTLQIHRQDCLNDLVLMDADD